ncbi:MAG: hypothetical protein DRH37_03435 [Deltaproteobacteria bacterium]|nr:MAG: hypothetical protein DRH37_03435 [Deltaproteobacteria bacterium]
MSIRNNMQSYVKFLTYMIAVVLINIAGTTLFFRIDLTANRLYSISEASRKVVSTLSEPLTIKVFFTRNLPAPYNNIERYLHDLLQEYEIYANRYFNYRFYNVSLDNAGTDDEAGENQKIAKEYGIYPVQVQNFEKDEFKFQKAYMGLVIIHGDMIEKIPTITTTDGLEYRLTTSIQKLNNKISALLNLKNKVRIRLFLSSSLKIIAPYLKLKDLPSLPKRVEEIVKELNAKMYGKLVFEYFDPSTDTGLEPELKKYNILGLNWPALSNGKIKPGSGFIGLVTQYGEKAISIPLINMVRIPLIGTQYSMADLNEIEDSINQSIESVININEDIGYLADHGTAGALPDELTNPLSRPRDNISNFRSLLSQTYSIRNVLLKDGTIPESFNCLIIAGPTKKFTDYELFQIDQYLMRGNSLALFMDTFNEITPPRDMQAFSGRRGPEFVPLDTGLEKLLDYYGVHMKRSYMMDKNCFRERSRVKTGGGEIPYYFVPVIKDRFINHAPIFMKNINELVMMRISPLELNNGRIKKNGLKAIRLFSSSDESWEMSGQINLNPIFIHPPPADEMKSQPMAYLLEGEFPSYFAGKSIPEKKTQDSEKDKTDKKVKKKRRKQTKVELAKIKSEGQIIPKGRYGRIFIIASSEILKNTMVDSEGRSSNVTFIMNVLDHLNGRDEIAVMRSKQQKFNPLAQTEPAVKMLIKSFNIAGLPILVIAFGLVVWYRRHSRQKRIRLMFQRQAPA